MKNSSPLSHISNGAIDFYYGLKMETKYSYKKLCDVVEKRVNNVIENYCNLVKSSLKEHFGSSQDFTGTLPNNMVDSCPETYDAKVQHKNVLIELTDVGFNLHLNTALNKYFQRIQIETESDYHNFLNVYGRPYVDTQTRITLPPIEVEINNQPSYIEAMLIIFENNYAVLRMTLILNDVDVGPLLTNNPHNYFKHAKPVCEPSQEITNATISDIKNYYCNFLLYADGVKSIYVSDRITNIMIANHSAMFNDINNIPKELKRDIYKISVAPLQERDNSRLDEQIELHFKKNSFFSNGIGYITSSKGRCVSIVDENLIISYAQKEERDDLFYRKIIHSLRSNIEFSFMIILLKNLNARYTFEKKSLHKRDLMAIKNHYNLNRIFISKLHDGTYGSVRDLTSFVEATMLYFVDKENITERMSAINEIVDGEQVDRVMQLQNSISILGAIFAAMFGLNAIVETLTYIRTSVLPAHLDIPILTISNCSITIWLAVISLFIYFFIKSKIKKL